MLKDINQTTPSTLDQFSGVTACGSLAYFTLESDDEQEETLWRSDGTEEGTFPIFTTRFIERMFCHANEVLYFHREVVWFKSDGTVTGTELVRDFTALEGQNKTHYVEAISNNGQLYFLTGNSEFSIPYMLWVGDGTETGTTKLLAEGTPSNGLYALNHLTEESDSASQEYLYFINVHPEDGWELWRTDGTEEGTVFLRLIPQDIESEFPVRIEEERLRFIFEGSVYIFAQSRLWRSSDAVPELSPILEPQTESTYLNPRLDAVVVLDGSFFFSGYGKMWRSDGTKEGTISISDYSSYWQTVVGNKMYFSATIGEAYEFGVSDGTANGTSIIDIYPGDLYGSHPSHLRDLNGSLLFFALTKRCDDLDRTLCGPIGLWKSDGDRDSTFLLATVSPEINNVSVADDLLFFAGDDGLSGVELWRSDGTESGTYLARDINDTTDDSYASDFVVSDGRIYFSATDGVRGSELWSSDGTRDGTQMIKDIFPGPTGSYIKSIESVGDQTLVIANDENYRSVLWRTDGTAEGTIQLSDAQVEKAVTWNDLFIFFGFSNEFGIQLWKSSGTPESTVLISTFDSNGSFTNITEFIPTPKYLYFTSSSADGYPALWRTDGTSEGTIKLYDTLPNPEQERPIGDSRDLSLHSYMYSNGYLYFLHTFNIYNGNTRIEIWHTDGSVEGTFSLHNAGILSDGPAGLKVVNESVYYEDLGDLWRIDPAANAVRVFAFSSGQLSKLTSTGNQLFMVRDTLDGAELWYMDGSTEELELVTVGTEISHIATDRNHIYYLNVSDSQLTIWAINLVTGLVTETLEIMTRYASDLRVGRPYSFGHSLYIEIEYIYAGLPEFAPGPELPRFWRIDPAQMESRPVSMTYESLAPYIRSCFGYYVGLFNGTTYVPILDDADVALIREAFESPTNYALCQFEIPLLGTQLFFTQGDQPDAVKRFGDEVYIYDLVEESVVEPSSVTIETKSPSDAPFDFSYESSLGTFNVPNNSTVTFDNIESNLYQFIQADASPSFYSLNISCIDDKDVLGHRVASHPTAISIPLGVEASVHCIFENTPPAQLGVELLASQIDVEVSGAVEYTYMLSNIGYVAVSDIQVVDSEIGKIDLETSALLPGESAQHSVQRIFEEPQAIGPITNTVTVTGTPTVGPMPFATASIVVNVSEPQAAPPQDESTDEPEANDETVEDPAEETPETPNDETPDDETPTDETPNDETPTDETPNDETPTDDQPASTGGDVNGATDLYIPLISY